jgi:hypothetical protein
MMKKIFLYKKQDKKIVETKIFALVDEEDYDSVSKNRWYLMKLYHCDTEILYARRYEGCPKKGNHKAILMHREILGATERSQKVDHRDGNGLNNKRDNIRICTHSDNMSNRKMSYKKDIKYLGVHFDKSTNTYKASMRLNGVSHNVYSFPTPELAALAYNDLVRKYKPDFGKLNEIKCQTIK